MNRTTGLSSASPADAPRGCSSVAFGIETKAVPYPYQKPKDLCRCGGAKQVSSARCRACALIDYHRSSPTAAPFSKKTRPEATWPVVERRR